MDSQTSHTGIPRRRLPGVEIVDGVAPLVDRVDAVLLETNDGGPHLQQAAAVLKAGKPLFVDKPVAAAPALLATLPD